MKVFCVSVLIIFLATAAGDAFPTPPVDDRDLSWLFPQIPGCVRVVQSLNKSGEGWEQTAVYEPSGYENNNGGNYFGCGSITLVKEATATKPGDERMLLANPFVRKLKVRGYPAFRSVPQCGNDESIGSTSVRFDKDKVLTAHAFRGSERILEFLETVDYEQLRIAADRIR